MKCNRRWLSGMMRMLGGIGLGGFGLVACQTVFTFNSHYTRSVDMLR